MRPSFEWQLVEREEEEEREEVTRPYRLEELLELSLDIPDEAA